MQCNKSDWSLCIIITPKPWYDASVLGVKREMLSVYAKTDVIMNTYMLQAREDFLYDVIAALFS